MINTFKKSILTNGKHNLNRIINNYLSYFKTEIIEFLNKQTHLEVNINQNNKNATLKFDPHWLRFNCQSVLSRQPSTGQRTIQVDEIPKELLIKSVEKKQENLHIIWNDVSKQSETIIPIEYLIKNYPSRGGNDSNKNYKPCVDLKFFNYFDLIDKNGKRNEENIFLWLKQLAEYGLCIVKNLPTENHKIRNLAELIAPLQKTIYDEIFDVKVDRNPINIAYSNVPLEFHMDLMYYESPPGIQFLHCLKFDSCIKGGESLFVDSFEIAEQFRLDHPSHFETLTKIPVTFQKVHMDRSRPVCMLYKRPHIVLNHRNKIIGVNWAPAFEGTLSDLAQNEIKSYYLAYLEFSKAVNNNLKKIEYKLEPGDVACFNNRRILHARNGFIQNNGVRHFQGCYLNIDEFKSEVLAREYYQMKKNSNCQIQKASVYVNDLELKDIMVGNEDFN